MAHNGPVIKQIKMIPAGKPILGKTVFVGNNAPHNFGDTDPRIQLLCTDCNAVVDTVPPSFQFRNLFYGEVVWVCRCGAENIGPLSQGEAGEEPA